MTSWAKPKDLLIAYKFASESEWRRHIGWLEKEGYPFIAQLRKEVERAGEKRRGPSPSEALGRSGQGDEGGLEEVEGGELL